MFMFISLRSRPLQLFLEKVCEFAMTLGDYELSNKPKLSYDRSRLSRLAGRWHSGQCLVSAYYMSGTVRWADDTENRHET